MEIIISALLAYVLAGVSQVTIDLGGNVNSRPMWAWEPTLGKAILVAIIWPTRPVIDNYSTGHARSIVFGVLGFVTKMTVLTAVIWGSYTIAGLAFENFAFQLILAAVIAFIGSLFVLPIISLLMIPITLLLAWPLDLLFPVKSKTSVNDINWCRTCKHYRKVSEYEDIMEGYLCSAKSMPRSDKLPCKIVLETSQVWEAFYKIKPKSRALFPKNCPHYEKQT
ncbi:MAG: hypothetical protein WAW61_18320 [Methylococcaceae bacterium]